MRFSTSGFPPSTWVYQNISNFFEKWSRRYSRFKVHHRWQMEKIFNQKNFNYFDWTPLGSRVNININFCLQIHFKVSAAWYCCQYLPPVSLTPVANLPTMSLIPVPICSHYRWFANLPPVSLILVVHLDLRKSPQIWKKNLNGPNGILWGRGKLIHEKNQKQKKLVTLSL